MLKVFGAIAPRRAHRRQCADPGRERHRQGTGGARNPSPVAARQRGLPAGGSGRAVAAIVRKRIVRPSHAAPSPTPSRTASAISAPPPAAPCSWTRSAMCRCICRAKLLTALERREVVPVGAEKPEPIDVRLISATNLQPRTADRRESVPPGSALSHQHGGDHAAALARAARGHSAAAGALCRLYAQKYNLPAKRFGAALMDRLTAYAWPGNVRALRHAVERAVILSEGDAGAERIFRSSDDGRAPRHADRRRLAPGRGGKSRHRAGAGDGTSNNVSRAAEALGLTRTSLYRRMEKYGL